ncbi:WD40 repeat domain-containing protein [Mesonia maritima]|uniref:WD40 repeat protein n=1 Tax=Mesonia maritima TaxID=1793873 RepID=A0ABU1K8T1_9FLAO|nr:hypothetical protein [Mesonia maritima]MDR6300988.1 WD40 repeat protein [Mesonia maritima]
MKTTSRITILISILILFSQCKQEIKLKPQKLTGNNPVAFTDVIYKSGRDTVFVSTYGGHIYEIINNKTKKKKIALLDDEIYSMAYNSSTKQIYAATLNSGIAVIDAENGKLIKTLKLKETWAHKLTYNQQSKLLATSDFKGNHYIWNTADNFRILETPKKIRNAQPKYITDNGIIYFNKRNEVLVWNTQTNQIFSHSLTGTLEDVDKNNNLLVIGGKQFALYNTSTDSLVYKNKHPNWPIYLKDKDSFVNVPLTLEIVSGKLGNNTIYTAGLDKTIRKWKKSTGSLEETLKKHRASISAISLNKNKSQLVSVDLSGTIYFWEL